MLKVIEINNYVLKCILNVFLKNILRMLSN